jgi:FAD/FMN-containing dehydrogenase
MQTLAQQLKAIVQGEVVSNIKQLLRYSRDASIFAVAPEVVVHPKNTEDLKSLVKFAATHKPGQPDLSLTARAGGTDMSGGPLGSSIVLDFTTHMNAVQEISGTTATVEPGLMYRDFEKQTNKLGVMLPSYTSSKDICALGGMVANNAGGEKSLAYGKTGRYVSGLNVVLSDSQEYEFRALSIDELDDKKQLNTLEGQIYREMEELLEQNYDLIQKAKPTVTKNSAGYAIWDVWDRHKFDLSKLFVGSQGTLGLISKINLRLVPQKKYSELVIVPLKSLQHLGDIINLIHEHNPECLESYDDHTVRAAVKYLPEMVSRMKENFFVGLWHFLPEVWQTLTHTAPELVILAEFAGNDEEKVFAQLLAVREELHDKYNLKSYLSRTEKEAKKYWTIRHESFNLLRKHSSELEAAPFIEDFTVHVAQLPEFLPRLNKILSMYPHLMYTIAGHPGDGNFHIFPLMKMSDSLSHDIVFQMSEQVFNLVKEYGGSTSGEHNDGIIRTPYLDKMYSPEILRIFEQVKFIFDPLNIFNPGKKVFGSLQYAKDHMRVK